MTAALDDAAWQQLALNASRLADAALQALADEIDSAALDAPAAGDDAAPATDLAGMDLSLLDALDLEPAPAPPGSETPRAEAAACLAALPASLPPLTAALDEAGIAAWLPLYRQGHDGLHRLVALLQRTGGS